MTKNLVDSYLDRKNILNNKFAVNEISQTYKISGVNFEGKLYYSTQQVADFFDVDIRTIERSIESNRDELSENDYEVLSGKRLADFKQAVVSSDITNNFDIRMQAASLSIASFRTILNFAMLLKNSDKAQTVRSRILDITIDVLTKNAGGNVKFVNQRDSNYLDRAFTEESERKKFTHALSAFVDMGPYKYAYSTDLIYKHIFKENTREYKKILQLAKKDNARSTMYSEVLLLIASFEAGVAYEIEQKYNELDRKLTKAETDNIIEKFSNHPSQIPFIEDARLKMASRDNSLRDAYHEQLKDYIQPLDEKEYDKFLGEQSKALEKQIEEHRDVFERLKDK